VREERRTLKKGFFFFYIQNHIFTIFDKKLEYIAENQDLNQKNRKRTIFPLLKKKKGKKIRKIERNF